MPASEPLAASIVRWADAFTRLEAVASLYPVAHQRSLDAARAVASEAAGIAGERGALQVEVSGDRMLVQSTAVPVGARAFDQLHAELDSLGMSELQVQVAAAPEHWYQLARALRQQTHRVVSTRVLASVDFSDLPDTIRIRMREFGRRSAAPAREKSAVQIEPWTENASRALAQSDLDEGARQTCRRWIDRSLRRVVERVEHRDSLAPAPTDASVRRPLDEVLALASGALDHALSRHLAEAHDAKDVRKLFEAVQLATAVSDDSQAAALIIDAVQRAADEVLEELGVAREATLDDANGGERFETTVEELRARLRQCCSSPQEIAQLDLTDRTELASILIEAALSAPAVPAEHVLARLRQVFHPPQTKEERELVAHAVRALAERADRGKVDALLPLFAGTLGDPHEHVWVRAAVEGCETRGLENVEALWPHLANVILRGAQAGTSALRERIETQLGRLPVERIPAALARLEKLDALVRGRLARDTFLRLRPDASRFYAALLRSRSAETVTKLLLAALRAQTPAWPGAQVVHLISDSEPSCRMVLSNWFEYGALDAPAKETREMAGKMIAQRLPDLARERREEPWVVDAIAALGRAGSREALAALEQVIATRKYFVAPSWPPACRDAARSALAALQAASEPEAGS